MSSYDMYLQRYQQAMAPAIDYMLRTQAATSVGVDYNSLSQSQINQFFGPTQYNSSQNNTTSPLQNMAASINGGVNPYMQSIQNMYTMNNMSNMYDPYGNATMVPYGQLSGYPSMGSLSSGSLSVNNHIDPAYTLMQGGQQAGSIDLASLLGLYEPAAGENSLESTASSEPSDVNQILSSLLNASTADNVTSGDADFDSVS